jgi:hypothetical protein
LICDELTDTFLGGIYKIVDGFSANNFPLKRISARPSHKVFLCTTIDELRCATEDGGNQLRRVELKLKSEITGVMCIFCTDVLGQKSMCLLSSSHDAPPAFEADRRTFEAV